MSSKSQTYLPSLAVRLTGNVDGYDEIDQPHSIVHEKAQEILNMIYKNGEIDQVSIIKRVEQIETATTALFNDLERLIETKFK